MSTTELAALVASVGACASALVGVFTVLEIAKQRKATFRPDIVPISLGFEARKNPMVNSEIPDYWVELHNPAKNGPVAEAGIHLVNVGLGAARYVEIVWDFDIHEAVRAANSLAQKSLAATYFELEEGVLTMQSSDGANSSYMWSNQKLQRFDYILPASTSASPTKARLPLAYCGLIAAILYFSSKMENPRFPDNLPKLKLDISYLDIAGLRHKANYTLSTEVSMIAGGGTCFHGRIEGLRRSGKFKSALLRG